MKYLKRNEWPNIVASNKEVLSWCTPDLKISRARFILKPYMLRLHACHLVRKQFIERLQTDIPFRIKYLYIHEPETGPTHICWRKVPPRCISLFEGLQNSQRLMSVEIEQLTRMLQNIDPQRYNWVLNNVRLVDGSVKINI